MAYYSINKYNVFFSDDRFAEIDKPYIEKLTALERFGLTSIKSQSLIVSVLPTTSFKCSN